MSNKEKKVIKGLSNLFKIKLITCTTKFYTNVAYNNINGLPMY